MTKNLRRIEMLEGRHADAETVVLVIEPGEAVDQATRRYEARYGDIPANSRWLPIETGVPRGEGVAWA